MIEGINESRQLTATVSPDDAEKSVIWTSDNDNIVTVDQSGEITSVNEGTTTIRATSTINGVIGTSSVTVEIPAVLPETINITPNQATLEGLDEQVQLSHEVLPAEADQSVAWSSDNESVATVSNNGLVTSVGEGSTTIKATSSENEVVGTASITVEIPAILPESVSITPNGVTIEEIGGEVQLSHEISPSGAVQDVVWSSGNEDVVTVSSSGLVTAVGEGSTTIKAVSTEASNVEQTINANVVIEEEEIEEPDEEN